MRPRIVTTSWDDGAVHDLRLAEILHKSNVKGTFYAPIVPIPGITAMTHAQLCHLPSLGMEVGGHGYLHQILPRLSSAEVWHSVQTCKQILEKMLGEPVRMFAYPNGRHNSEVVRQVRQAGYKGARTIRMLADSLSFSPFEMPTTVQAFPHSPGAYIRNTLRSGNMGRVFRYAGYYCHCDNWMDLAKKSFDRMLDRGGIWHLFGHSWEIDRLDLWADLENVLEYVSGRQGVQYLSNSDALAMAQANGKYTA